MAKMPKTCFCSTDCHWFKPRFKPPLSKTHQVDNPGLC